MFSHLVNDVFGERSRLRRGAYQNCGLNISDYVAQAMFGEIVELPGSRYSIGCAYFCLNGSTLVRPSCTRP